MPREILKTLHIPVEDGRSTPGVVSWGSSSQFPPEMLEQSRSRLGALAGLLATLEIIVLVILVWGPIPDQYEPQGLAQNLEAIGLQATASLLIAVLCMTKLLPRHHVLTAGLIFQVFVCWLTSVAMTRAAAVDFGHLPMITWTEPTIILFPLLVPSPPGRTLLAAIASALTRPFALYYLAAKGEIAVNIAEYIGSMVSPAIAAIMALVGARLIYRISRDAAAAREMGSYRLEAMLGKGGMGEVWRANHQLLARPAAVKLIRPEVLGAPDPTAARAALDRFEREAQVTANLKSQHTIQLYDYGRTDDGVFYYVMELLDGVDMNTLVDKYGPVPAERTVHLLRQLCHSLEEAHIAGLVHRDIKPANVFTCRYGLDRDFVKVLDFGLVKGEAAGTDNITLTAGNAIIGTPAFMAPEMAKGDNVDARADIYSVGCLAFWLLTGRLVFEGNTAMAVALAHMSEDAPRVVDVSEGAIPPALDDIIARCLAKNPDERPQTVQELGAAICAIDLDSPWTSDRADSWWRKHNPQTVLAESSIGA